jgi:hypothetical protein
MGEVIFMVEKNAGNPNKKLFTADISERKNPVT